MTTNIFTPQTLLALTSGPGQPEFQSFMPYGTTELVDLFSGDFQYNIPLLDVDGYPINLTYNSAVTMEQEASWVGLGWNLNVGSITRNLRGLPDDFSGDLVKKETSMKPNDTYGGSVGIGAEILGFEFLKINISKGLRYNNYTGLSIENSASFSFGDPNKDGLNASLGLSSSTQGGFEVSPSVSFTRLLDDNEGVEAKGGLSFGASFNSRQGLYSTSFGYSLSYSKLNESSQKTEQYSSNNGGSSIPLGINTYIPKIDLPRENGSFVTSFKLGGTVFTF